MPVAPVPAGYHRVTPYLIVRDAGKAIEFYKRAFGAVETMRLEGRDGRIGHAEVRIGDGVVMLADEMPEMGYRGPLAIGGTPVSLHLYVEDVDACFDRAVAEGAESKRPVATQFYGDRTGTLIDPFGHQWTVATHVEEVAPEEVERRFKAMQQPGTGGEA